MWTQCLLHCEMDMNLWRTGMECNGLDLKYPQRLGAKGFVTSLWHCWEWWEVWPCERKWSQDGVLLDRISGSWVHPLLCFLATKRGAASYTQCFSPCWAASQQATGAKTMHWKLWSQEPKETIILLNAWSQIFCHSNCKLANAVVPQVTNTFVCKQRKIWFMNSFCLQSLQQVTKTTAATSLDEQVPGNSPRTVGWIPSMNQGPLHCNLCQDRVCVYWLNIPNPYSAWTLYALNKHFLNGYIQWTLFSFSTWLLFFLINSFVFCF